MRRLCLAGALAAGGSLLLAVSGGTALAASIGGFGAYPAAAPGQSEPYFTLRIAPGDAETATAVVVNSSARPVALAVEPVAGLTGQTSGSVYGNAVTPARGGLALTPAVRDVTLAAHARRRIALRVAVAPGAYPGDHLAGLAVVDRHRPTGRGRVRITEIIRVVIGVSVRVPGDATQRLRIGGLAPESLGSGPDAAVRVALRNDGGLYCQPRLTVRLSRAGAAAITQTRVLGTLLPRTSIEYPMAWRHALPRGTYAATATATGCGVTRRVSQAFVVRTTRPAALPRNAAPVITPVRTERSFGGWSVLALVGAVGAGLGGLGGLIARRRRTPPSASERSTA